jgi:transposase-like protein
VTRKFISDEQAAEVVAGYLAGEKVSSLAERLGLPLSTVYWILDRQGVSPNRAKKRMRLATQDAAPLFRALAEQEDLIVALEQEILELREQLRGLLGGGESVNG